MLSKQSRLFITLFLLIPVISFSQIDHKKFHKELKEELKHPNDGCTSVMVGINASYDGSVMTSHTCDGHRYRTWVDIQAAADHKEGSMAKLTRRVNDDSKAMPANLQKPIGEIPQVEHTYAFINSAYPAMNEKQLAIGESTFGGRDELKSDNGIIDCQALIKLMLERCTTARGAIELARELTKKYGYTDYGECLTIADTKEVWQFEIVGPGKGNKGSIWVARRIPDDHIGVVANASRIREIDFDNDDYFKYSENVTELAKEKGWWDPVNEKFEFCYAYDPTGRRSLSSRRREWRVLSLAAPSLNLDPNAENYPFSVKPEELMTREMMVRIFQDYYEGTPFNFVKNITWVNKDGETEISPFANPFMPYDMNPIFKINGGWNWRGERPIARWYTIYGTITQSRGWLPDEIGGVCWFAWDNIATSIYVPLYCSITDLPESFKTPGRPDGYTRESAWWAFNRMSTLAAQRWGDIRKDVEKLWNPMQEELFSNQSDLEAEAKSLLENDRTKAIKFLTDYSNKWGRKVVKEAWKFGDFIWTKYDEKF